MNSKSVFVKVVAAAMVTITLGTTTIVFPSYAEEQAPAKALIALRC